MERRFLIRSELDRQCCRALVQSQLREKKLKVKAMCITCSVIILLCSAMLWMMGDSDALGFTLAGIFFMVFALGWEKFLSWLTYRSINGDVGETEHTFEESGIQFANNLGNSEVKYAALVKLVETDGYFMLYVQKNMAYVLPKKAFEEGDPSAFAAFLEEKTGKKCRRIRSL